MLHVISGLCSGGNVRTGNEPEVLQVVDLINRRCGSSFEAQYVGNPNGHGAPGMNGIENACGLASVRSMFNESTLFTIASQYAMDVINYGYM